MYICTMENWRVFDLAVSFSSHFQRKYNVTQESERAIRTLVRLAKSSSALGDVLILSQEVRLNSHCRPEFLRGVGMRYYRLYLSKL